MFFFESEPRFQNSIACSSRTCERLFRKLKFDVATGTDNIPARILIFIGPFIAIPFTRLVQRMLQEGVWPDEWRDHRLVPLFNCDAYFRAGNYRGIHITTILSKIAERLIAHRLAPLLQLHGFGPNQWA